MLVLNGLVAAALVLLALLRLFYSLSSSEVRPLVPRAQCSAAGQLAALC